MENIRHMVIRHSGQDTDGIYSSVRDDLEYPRTNIAAQLHAAFERLPDNDTLGLQKDMLGVPGCSKIQPISGTSATFLT